MTPAHYYNEHNAYRAAVLRERMEDGLLPQGVVDERDIEIVPDEDFQGYTHIHLFAGIGGFPLGLRRAGFPEDVRIVTGGFPCQDISNAGKRAGITGSRSRLWREMVRCIRVVRPQLVFVENVAALLCRGMGDVLGDLAAIGYDAEGDCISAADVGAPHLRRRIWIVAHARSEQHKSGSAANERAQPEELLADDSQPRIGRLPAGRRGSGETALDAEWCREAVADATESVRGESLGRGGLSARSGETVADAAGARCDGRARGEESFRGWPLLLARLGGRSEISNATETRLEGTDFEEVVNTGAGRPNAIARRSGRWPVEPDVGRVAYGIPKRVDRLAALGDAIVPQCVEEMIRRAFASHQDFRTAK